MSQRLAEPDDAELGRAVVGLSEVSVQASGTGGVDHPPEVVLAQQRPGGTTHVHGSGEVDLEHLVPVLAGHLQERHVAKDASVVDHDVDATEGVRDRGDRSLHRITIGHVADEAVQALVEAVDREVEHGHRGTRGAGRLRRRELGRRRRGESHNTGRNDRTKESTHELLHDPF